MILLGAAACDPSQSLAALTGVAVRFNPRRASGPFVLAPLLVLAAGCAGEYTGDKLKRFTLDLPSQFLLCPREGHYVVGVRQSGIREIAIVNDTWTYVRGGEEMGFRRDAAGRVVAYTRHEEYDLGTMPAGVKYLTWYRPYYREALVPPEAVADAVAGAVVEGAIAGAGEAADAAVDKITGHDDDDDDKAHNLKRRRHR